MAKSKGVSAKSCVESVFGSKTTDMIWTANTLMVIPATLQGFSVGAVLPLTMYLARRGFRRGRGKFEDAYSPQDKVKPTVSSVATRLAMETEKFVGFEDEVAQDILGDLLLSDALENNRFKSGRNEPIARVYPSHYFSSIIDLPRTSSHLRFVPEMLVALMVNQQEGETVETSTNACAFSVAAFPKSNVLLNVFSGGVQFGSNPSDLMSDRYVESVELTIEELLVVRLAEICGQAPDPISGRAVRTIPNRWPISIRANQVVRDDLRKFLVSYGKSIPRRAITPMLESLIGLGLLTILIESLWNIQRWYQSGVLPDSSEAAPKQILVDASNGIDHELRSASEQSMESILSLLDASSVAMATVRILDSKARYDRYLGDLVPRGPDSTEWLNLLGDLRLGKHPRSDSILDDLFQKSAMLEELLSEEGIEHDACTVLTSRVAKDDPASALAQAVCLMMTDKLLRLNYLKFLDGCLMANLPHGLCSKRRTQRSQGIRGRKMVELRSIVLSDTMLEVLVHRYSVDHPGLFSFADFLRELRVQYGLCIDVPPTGMELSIELLQRNKDLLEARLRDLGLLHGVNDAESMKRMVTRFEDAAK